MQKGFTMKNIHTLLSEIGFTVPEDKKVDFEKAFADNYKTVSEVEKLRTSRDNYKSQLETAQTALKSLRVSMWTSSRAKSKSSTATL